MQPTITKSTLKVAVTERRFAIIKWKTQLIYCVTRLMSGIYKLYTFYILSAKNIIDMTKNPGRDQPGLELMGTFLFGFPMSGWLVLTRTPIHPSY
jgi:hypothetical protein